MGNLNYLNSPHRLSAIMGPSGCGKTSLLSVLSGKQKATSGTLEINGKKIDMARFKKLAGFVPQVKIFEDF